MLHTSTFSFQSINIVNRVRSVRHIICQFNRPQNLVILRGLRRCLDFQQMECLHTSYMKRQHDGICHKTGFHHHLNPLIWQLTFDSLPPESLFLPCIMHTRVFIYMLCRGAMHANSFMLMQALKICSSTKVLNILLLVSPALISCDRNVNVLAQADVLAEP